MGLPLMCHARPDYFSDDCYFLAIAIGIVENLRAVGRIMEVGNQGYAVRERVSRALWWHRSR